MVADSEGAIANPVGLNTIFNIWPPWGDVIVTRLVEEVHG